MHPSRNGFTLIELMLTVAVGAILTTLAVPSFQGVMENTRLVKANNRMAGALQLARSMAVSRGVPSILCPSHDGRHCVATMQWEDGWLVASDRDGDGQPDGARRHVFPAQPEGIHVRSTPGRLRVHFRPNGSAPGSNLTLTICLAGDPDSARSLVLSNVGRARQGQPDAAHAQDCAGHA